VKKTPTPNVNNPNPFKDTVRQFLNSKRPRDQDVKDGSTEVMWLRDLLIPEFEDARIATYSYISDWMDRDVKTSLRQCAEQFLNILLQHRLLADVSGIRAYSYLILSLKHACH